MGEKVYIKVIKGSAVKELRLLSDNSLLKKFVSLNTVAIYIVQNGYKLVEKK